MAKHDQPLDQPPHQPLNAGLEGLPELLRFQSAVLDAVTQPVLAVDADKTVIFWNRAAAATFGWAAHEAIGRPVVDLLRRDMSPELQAEIADAVRLGRSWSGDYDITRRDGTVVTVTATDTPLLAPDGELQALITVTTDRSERIEVERALRAGEERFRLVLDHAPVGVLRRDIDGRWLDVNHALCQLLGRTADELRTLTVEDIVHPDDLGLEQEVTRRLLAGEGPVLHVEKRYLHADGHAVHVVASVALAPQSLAGPAHFIVQVQDVSDRKRLEELRDLHIEELRRSNAELEQFAYVASHDLSEPLRAISGPVSLLGRRYKGQLDAEADGYIAFAVEGCVRMQVLIDDLLAYSRLGRVATDLGPVDCAAVVASVQRALRDQIERTTAEITVGQLPTVWGNAPQVGQVFQNLLSNAMKFATPESPPIVAVAAEERGGSCRFTVTDRGIGIEPRHRERVFGMFKRLHGRDEYPGTGIGLAIVKKVVEQHRGRIGIEDGPGGVGTTFWFTVPTREWSRT